MENRFVTVAWSARAFAQGIENFENKSEESCGNEAPDARESEWSKRVPFDLGDKTRSPNERRQHEQKTIANTCHACIYSILR